MTFDLQPFPRNRQVVIDAGFLSAERHLIHGLLELDVTLAREILKDSLGSDGQPLSFTAFIIASYARAIQLHPGVQAFRDIRGRLVLFHDVDVSTLVEPSPGAVALPHIIRAANTRSTREISEEIRAVQHNRQPGGKLERTLALGTRLPRLFRLLYFHVLRLNPERLKRVTGTTLVSSFGMFGKKGGWGIGFLPLHSVGLLVGGVVEKPMAYKGNVALRQSLHATLSFNHDIVDGAPAARFARTFADLVESAAALDAAFTSTLD
jgi:pyruvate/2-oxoglutarate dehydrogenase complex dihydrolipoamide acyltransferase (E2) component